MEQEITTFGVPSNVRRQEMLAAERALLLLSEIEPEFIQSNDMLINDSEYIHYTTISKRDKNVTKRKNNVMVMLHGYGGFGATFYKLAGKLADQFHLILVDLPGFGFSSRPDNVPFDCTETCIQFFVSRLKLFVDKLELPRFTLVGHSLGSYLSAHFFKEHHKQVRKLILLSPAGMNLPFENQMERVLSKFVRGGSLVKYLGKRFLTKVFESKVSPFELISWPIKPLAINFYLKNKRFGFTANEQDLIYRLQHYFSSLPQRGERCIGYLMHYGPKSLSPIMDILVQLRNRSSAISIIYGEFDTMDKELTAEKFHEHKIAIKIVYASDSDHQLLFQNCEEIRKQVIIDCKVELEAKGKKRSARR